MTSSNTSILGSTFILLLFCFISSTDLTNSIDKSEHLCMKIAQGHFDRIQIKSITFLTFGFQNQLIIFEDDKMYKVELSQINNTGMEMNLNEYQWNKDFLDQGVRMLEKDKRFDVKKMTAVYLIYEPDGFIPKMKLSLDDFEYIYKASLVVAMVFTNETIYFIRIVKDISLFKEIPNKFPNFALLQYQSGDNSQTTGFVIHKDIYALTDQLVMYDMKYTGVYRMQIHRKTNIDDNERLEAEYYYLEKSKTVGRIDLVPRSARGNTPQGDPATQLIGNSIPRGFILHGYLFLLDSQAGCVYVIGGNIGNIKLKETYTTHPNATLTFPIVGIPFEKFIRCTGVKNVHPYPHAADRCDVKRNSSPVQHPLTPPSESVDILSTVLLLFLVFFLLICLCVGGWFCLNGQSLSNADSGPALDLKMITGLKMRLKQKKMRNSASSAALGLIDNSTLRQNSNAQTSNISSAASSPASSDDVL